MTHICEKDFTFTEDLNFSPGREGAAELLTSRVTPTVTEAKVVGSKLVFKGLFDDEEQRNEINDHDAADDTQGRKEM